MIALIFSMSILVFSSICFISSSTYQALDNTFVSLNYSLPKLWVVTDIEGKSGPLYDKEKVESTTIAHFKNNLKFYLDKIQVGFYYFDSTSMKEESDRYISGVRISLKANITLNYKYSKAMIYTITKKD